MALPPETALKPGIYAVRFRRPNGMVHDGVASFGRRPTVQRMARSCCLKPSCSIFPAISMARPARSPGRPRLRGEEKFDGLEPLVAQMKIDEAEARAVLGSLQPLSPLDATITFETGMIGGKPRRILITGGNAGRGWRLPKGLPDGMNCCCPAASRRTRWPG
jgi:riboflavin kinase/FMN adenylyltransferase